MGKNFGLAFLILSTAFLFGCSSSSKNAPKNEGLSATENESSENSRSFNSNSTSSLINNTVGEATPTSETPKAAAASNEKDDDDDDGDDGVFGGSTAWFLGSVGAIAGLVLVTDAISGGEVVGVFGDGEKKPEEGKPEEKPTDAKPAEDCPPESTSATEVDPAIAKAEAELDYMRTHPSAPKTASAP